MDLFWLLQALGLRRASKGFGLRVQGFGRVQGLGCSAGLIVRDSADMVLGRDSGSGASV